MESQLMLNHTTCCNLSFNYRYVSFFLFPTFPAISSSWKSPPYMCLNSGGPRRHFRRRNPPRIGWLVQQSFLSRCFGPGTEEFTLGSTPNPFIFLNFKLFQHIVSWRISNFLRFNCCFFFAIRDFYFSMKSKLPITWRFLSHFFFKSSHFFSMFPWVSLLTWFSP
jgi:hypothetical protein